MVNMIKFWFREWKNWKIKGIEFFEAYEWYKNGFKLSEAIEWRSHYLGDSHYLSGIHCTPHFAVSARMFGLSIEEAIERFTRWLGKLIVEPLVNRNTWIEYKGIERSDGELIKHVKEQIGKDMTPEELMDFKAGKLDIKNGELVYSDRSIPVFDADLDIPVASIDSSGPANEIKTIDSSARGILSGVAVPDIKSPPLPHILQIKNPIWKYQEVGINFNRLIGLNDNDYICLEIMSVRKDGSRIYPDLYCMTVVNIKKHSIQTLSSGIKLYIIPIKELIKTER